MTAAAVLLNGRLTLAQRNAAQLGSKQLQRQRQVGTAARHPGKELT
jgi:hypothetical protein